eukprot:18190-Heterococcus_DN1.PRE.2
MMITTVLAALPVQPLPTKQWWPFTSSSDSNKAHSGLMCHPDAAGLSSMHYYMGNAGTGAPFHVHSDAINIMLTGTKRYAHCTVTVKLTIV